jgi:hypothetical protein
LKEFMQSDTNTFIAVKTDLWRQMPADVRNSLFGMLPMKSQSQGTATPLVAALDPKLAYSNGAYLDDCQVQDVAPWASDAGKAQKLWYLSEKLTGISRCIAADYQA